MENLLIVGFLFGLRHAIESDHFAAVASLTTQSANVHQAVRIGLVWGLGHTMTLFLIGGIVLAFDSVVPETFSALLEWFVGLMLVLLGIDLIRRIWKEKIHFHSHAHSDGVKHFHAHSHKNETKPHDQSPHDHYHSRRFTYRAFFVGLIHGLAGSAALILLTLGTTQSLTLGMLYILIFGLGSVLGMGVLSFVIAIPILRWKHINNVYSSICILAALVTISVGIYILYENNSILLTLI